MSEALSELSSYLREMRGDLFLDASISYDELNVTSTPETILALRAASAEEDPSNRNDRALRAEDCHE